MYMVSGLVFSADQQFTIHTYTHIASQLTLKFYPKYHYTYTPADLYNKEKID